MFGIDHGQPGAITEPVTLDPRHAVGSAAYATWAERSRLLAAAAEGREETRALARVRRRATVLRRRAEQAEGRVRRLEAVARAH